jgi:hypothetical protein
MKSRPDIRFIPFVVTEFDTLGAYTTAFLTELAKQATASKGMHVGKLLASWRRKVSLSLFSFPRATLPLLLPLIPFSLSVVILFFIKP